MAGGIVTVIGSLCPAGYRKLAGNGLQVVVAVRSGAFNGVAVGDIGTVLDVWRQPVQSHQIVLFTSNIGFDFTLNYQRRFGYTDGAVVSGILACAVVGDSPAVQMHSGRLVDHNSISYAGV